MGATIDNLGLLQINYIEDLVVDILQNGAKAFKDVETKTWEGLELDFRLRTARTTGMSFTEDGGARSTADKQDYVTAKAGRRFYEAKVQVSIGALAAAKSRSKSFLSVVESEVKGVMNDALSFFNKFYFRDGTGVVGLLKGSPASATANIQIDNAQLLWRGGIYEVRDTSASDAVLNDIKVKDVESAIDTDGWAQFAIDTTYGTGIVSASAAAADKVVWKGTGANSAWNRVFSGLDLLVDDASSTFQNVNVTTYPEYAAYVDSGGGTNRPLTPLLLRRTLAAVAQKAGNSDRASRKYKAYSNAWIGAEWEGMYEGAYRLSAGDGSVGFNAPRFMSQLGEVELDNDTDCVRNKLFLVDRAQVKHLVQKPLSFDRIGNEVFVPSQNNMTASAVMSMVSQMMIEDRTTSAKLEDIEDNAQTSY